MSTSYPMLGHLPVDEITTADVLGVLTPMWDAVPVDRQARPAAVRKDF